MDLLMSSSYSSGDLRELAERAGVRYVLVGQMTRAGDIIRINTTLQEARTGEVLGSVQVEGQGVDSLFSLIDDLTTRIKEEFKLSEEKIASDVDARVEDITTSSAEAQRYYYEGMTYHNRGDYTKSIPYMELAVAHDPEFAMAYRTMSVAYQNLGYQNEADRRLERAFQLRDRVSERERYYIEADYYRRTEETYDQAIAAYEKLLAIYPDDNVGNNNLGVVYNAIEDYDKALECFEVNVRNRQKSYHSYSNLANIYLLLGQLRKSEGVSRLFLEEIADHATIRAQLAGVLMRQRKFDEALQEVDKALTLNPAAPEAIVVKGNIFFLRDEREQALAEYRKMLEIEQPMANLSARNVLSNFYIAQGKFALAEEQLLDGLSLAEMIGENTLIAEMHSGLSYLHVFRGRTQEAARESELAVQSASLSGSKDSQRRILFNRALVLILSGDLTGARRVVEDLRKIGEQSLNRRAVRYVYLLDGILLERDGKHTEALDEFERARELMPMLDGAQALLSDAVGEALWAAGEPEKALRVYTGLQKRLQPRLENPYLYVRSFLQAAKILKEQGKDGEARKYLEDLLALWKDADPGIPMLQAARQQLGSLSR